MLVNLLYVWGLCTIARGVYACWSQQVRLGYFLPRKDVIRGKQAKLWGAFMIACGVLAMAAPKLILMFARGTA